MRVGGQIGKAAAIQADVAHGQLGQHVDRNLVRFRIRQVDAGMDRHQAQVLQEGL